jgi:hypothetical protein
MRQVRSQKILTVEKPARDFFEMFSFECRGFVFALGLTGRFAEDAA